MEQFYHKPFNEDPLSTLRQSEHHTELSSSFPGCYSLRLFALLQGRGFLLLRTWLRFNLRACMLVRVYITLEMSPIVWLMKQESWIQQKGSEMGVLVSKLHAVVALGRILVRALYPSFSVHMPIYCGLLFNTVLNASCRMPSSLISNSH